MLDRSTAFFLLFGMPWSTPREAGVRQTRSRYVPDLDLHVAILYGHAHLEKSGTKCWAGGWKSTESDG